MYVFVIWLGQGKKHCRETFKLQATLGPKCKFQLNINIFDRGAMLVELLPVRLRVYASTFHNIYFCIVLPFKKI